MVLTYKEKTIKRGGEPDTKGECFMQRKLKRGIALLLVASLCQSNGLITFASSIHEEENALKASLAAEVEKYPKGAFAFSQTQLEGKEGDKKLELVVVRKGGTDQEASIDFKAVNVSASYEKDYTLTLKENAIMSKELKNNKNAIPMTETYTDGKFALEEKESSQEATTSAISVKKDDKKKATKESTGLIEKESALKTARNAFLGQASDREDWQQIASGADETGEEAINQGKEAMEEFAQDIEGIEETLYFGKGEYKKVIEIDIKDDKISESDEQVMFLLSNAKNAELANEATAYLNIEDNDAEEIVFAMKEKALTVNKKQGTIKVTIKRTTAKETFASATVSTVAIDAVPGEDYEAVNTEVVFPQGVTEQTIEIPIINNKEKKDMVTFAVAINKETANVEKDKNQTVITIYTDDKEVLEDDIVEVDATKIDENGAAAVSSRTKNTDTYNAELSASVNGYTNSSSTTTYISNVDLRYVEKIKLRWKSNEGSRTISRKKCDGGDYTVNGRTTTIEIGGKKVASRGDNFGWTWTNEIEIPSDKRTQNVSIVIRVKTTGENNSARARIGGAVLTYAPYTFKMNCTNTVGNQLSYTEKIFMDNDGKGSFLSENGHTYKLGNKIKLGEATISSSVNGTNAYSTGITVYKPGKDTLLVNHNYTNAGKNSNGVEGKVSSKGNVYLAGYQLRNPGVLSNSVNAWTDTILPSELEFTSNFIEKYKKNVMSNNTFEIRPVYKPYPATIVFENVDESKGGFSNGYKNKNIIRCTQLDTFKVKGIAKKGYAELGLQSYQSKDLRNQSNLTSLAKKAKEYESVSCTKTIRVGWTTKTVKVTDDTSKYKSVTCENKIQNAMEKNVITFSPVGEINYITLNYHKSKIVVTVDPKSNNKDKGSVIYVDEDKNEVKEGAWSKENPNSAAIVLEDILLNSKLYYFGSAIKSQYENKYRIFWKDWTGDNDRDGVIDEDSVALRENYKLVDTASYGNTFAYLPKLPETLIYYGFEPKAKNEYEGVLDGTVYLSTTPVFGSKSVKNVLPGASVTVNGETVITNKMGKYSFSGKEFTTAENYTVNIAYEGLLLTDTQAVNARRNFTLQAYDTFSVSKDSKILQNNKQVSAAGVSTKDSNVTIILNTVSSISALVAKKAEVSFYRKDGTQIGDSMIVDNKESNTGIFNISFNPKAKGIPAGAKMKVCFYDQNGKRYYQHDMGITFMEDLGVLSILSSFNFGGAEKVIPIIGKIDSAFNFGWDGDVTDASSPYVTISGQDTPEDISDDTTTLSFGFGLGYMKERPSLQTSGSTSDMKDATRSVLKRARDKSKAEKVKGKIAANGYINFNFAIGMTMQKSEVELGKWYFKDMTLLIEAGGGGTVAAQFMTPIGIPIMVSCTGEADGAALLAIQQKDNIECYFNNLREEKTGTIDLFKFNTSNPDAPLEAYGEFSISPKITLGAAVGWSMLNVGLKGSADFDFNFYTQADKKNTGNVNLAAYLTLKLLLFDKEFKIISKDLNLYGGDANAKALALSNQDYLQTGLEELKINERDYLKNRNKWNGERKTKTQSVASSSGVVEQQLMEGIYPYPDIQMEEIGDGKYLAVFTDDVPERTKENSTAVYYTIYDGNTWSKPQIIENDGTVDDSPTMLSCGNQILVAWSTADKVFDQNVNAIDMLQSRNIHGKFFDITTGKFGEIHEITKSTEEDVTGNVEPNITYDEESQQMMVYYTKSEYSTSNAKNGDFSDAVIADAIFPYSLIAYRSYDMKNNKWEEGYSKEDVASMKASMKTTIIEAGLATEETYDTYFDETYIPNYISNWYGQNFLNLAPTVSIDETLDEAGYWKEKPAISPYAGSNDPYIVESNTASYNGLGLYFYVLDNDGKEETTNDRDIFLQIYDFEEKSFTHPIMITNDDVQDSNLRMIRMNNATILGYLSDGKVMTLDVSHLVKHNLIKESKDGVEYYYIDKTNYLAQGSSLEKDIYNYIPPMCVVDKQIEQEAEENTESLITSFDFRTKDNYAYAIWTQQKVKLKDGIKEGSEEAAKVENKNIETQIYASRYDGTTENITEPIQITDADGANYSQIAFMVTKDGGMKALAAKSQSKVEEIKDKEEGVETSFVAEDTKNRTLVALDFKPTSTLSLSEVESGDLAAGGIDVNAENLITLSFKNEGMDTISGSALEIKTKQGEVVYTEDANTIGEIYGGRTYTTTFNLPLDENATGCQLEITVKDKNGTVILSEDYIKEIPVNLVVDSMDAELTDREELTIHATITNESERKSPATKLEIGRLDEEGKNVSMEAIEVKELQMGESVTVSKKMKVDYEKDFDLKQTADGSYGADVKLYAKADGESITYDTVNVWAGAEQLNLMKAINSVVISNGSDLTGNVQLKQGRITKINANVKLNPFDSGSLNNGSNDKNYVNNFANGLKVIWTADNNQIVKVHDNGYVEGLKEGTTTLNAYIMPADNEVISDVRGNAFTKNNIISLPDQAIRKESVKVTVVKETKVSLDKKKLSIPVKGNGKLKATVSGSLSDKTVTWSSSDRKIATVSKTGVVTGKKVGTVTITATTKDGKKVNAVVTVTSITLNKKSVSLGKGESFVIQPTLSKGTTDKLSGVRFATSNKKIVRVVKTKNGKATIKAIKTGKAKITVTSKSGAKQVLTVTVKKAPTKVTVKPSKVTLKKGKTKKLAVSFPSKSTSFKLLYSSSNKKIATVSKTGVVTAKKKGTTTITVKSFNGKKAKVKITIK